MVTLFTSPTCGACRQVKKYLNIKNIAFKEKDITDGHDKECYEVSGAMTVPVVTNGEKVVRGFIPSELAKLA